MNELTLFILILIIIVFLAIIYVIYYNIMQNYLIKINEVESKIDQTLREWFDLLNEEVSLLSEDIKQDLASELNKFKDEALSNFELERKLNELTIKIQDCQKEDLKSNDNYNLILFKVKDNNETLEAYINYYNDNITVYNKYVRVFPSNIVSKLSKLKEKTFYDGKNMSDRNVNDFKL